MTEKSAISLIYTNWKGETSLRTVIPTQVPVWGSTEHHPEPQWLLGVWDVDKQEARTYALADCQFLGHDPHPDDVAVQLFAHRMRAKMKASREKGRSGWDDPEDCSLGFLQNLLDAHVRKGDPVDVANIAMMLAHRGARTVPQIKVYRDLEGSKMLVGEENSFRIHIDETGAVRLVLGDVSKANQELRDRVAQGLGEWRWVSGFEEDSVSGD